MDSEKIIKLAKDIIAESILGFSWNGKVNPATLRDSFFKRMEIKGKSFRQHWQDSGKNPTTQDNVKINQFSSSDGISLRAEGIHELGRAYARAGKFKKIGMMGSTEKWEDPNGNRIWISRDRIMFPSN